MHRQGHLGLALAFVAPYSYFLATSVGMAFALGAIGIAVAVSDLPDKDQHIPGLSHRGFSHTLWAALIVSSAAGGVGYSLAARLPQAERSSIQFIESLATASPEGVAWFVAIAAFLGYVSHLFGDMLTVGSDYYGMNVEPFAPISNASFQLGLTKADSKFWNGFLLLTGTIATAGSLYLTA
jgi:inner membrane protein